jgi:hypothetical protein
MHNEMLTVVAMRVSNLQISRETNLEQPKEFEDNHDNDDYSNYVENAPVHARDSYQGEYVAASFLLLTQGRLDPTQSVLYSRSHHARVRVYDKEGNVIEPHEHAGDFREQ